MSRSKELIRSVKQLIEVSNFERRAMIALLFLCLIVIGVRWLKAHVFTMDRSPDPELLAAVDRILAERNSKDSVNYQYFDPNNDSLETLINAGVPKKLARQMIAFRTKVRPFYKVEDLKDLYAMDDELYVKLQPFVKISISEAFRQKSVKMKSTGEFSARMEYPEESDVPQIPVLELNTCLTEELELLPGIGPSYAKRIVAYRKLLGGYVQMDQLKEVYGLSDSLVRSLSPYLEIDTLYIAKLDINNLSEEDLRRHPYIGYKEARLIVAYRKAHGRLKKDDLYGMQALSKEYLDKLMPYLD